jgi:hypothetical protein
MLGPHLDESNVIEVLARAKHRTKKEIARLIRLLDPLPDVPSRIEPLGPAPARLIPNAPTWGEFVQSTCPVRELSPGERPRDWTGSSSPAADAEAGGTVEAARPESERDDGLSKVPASPGLEHLGSLPERPRLAPEPAPELVPERPSSAPERPSSAPERPSSAPERPSSAPELVPELVPERYGVQFTTSKEYVELVDRARALLSHSVPRLTLEELHLRALRSFVAELERKKYGAVSRPRKRSLDRDEQEAESALEGAHEPPKASEVERVLEIAAGTAAETDMGSPLDRPERTVCDLSRRPDERGQSDRPDSERRAGEQQPPRWRGRHVPAPVRRSVFERDQGRCTYTSETGRRCAETHRLELHHLVAFARGGEPTEENLTLRCQAHNTLAAEEDFGRAFIEAARGSSEHDPWPT